MKAVLVWGLICVVFMVELLYLGNQTSLYTGSQATFYVSNDRLIAVKSDSKAQFASSRFFALRQGEAILSAKSAPVPLGWQDKEYYTADSDHFSGTWSVMVGSSITARISSEGQNEIAVYLTEGAKAGNAAMAFVGCVFLFLVGLLLGYGVTHG